MSQTEIIMLTLLWLIVQEDKSMRELDLLLQYSSKPLHQCSLAYINRSKGDPQNIIKAHKKASHCGEFLLNKTSETPK